MFHLGTAKKFDIFILFKALSQITYRSKQKSNTLNWKEKDKVTNHRLDVPFKVLDQIDTFN